MTAAMRFSVRLPHSWCSASPEAIARVADQAEALGYWGVTVQDHLLGDQSISPCGDAHDGDDRTVLDALHTLTFLAGRTKQLYLMTGVLILGFHDPIRLAKELATIDVLSNGRLAFGVGVGTLPPGTPTTAQPGAPRSMSARTFDLYGGIARHRGHQGDEYLEAIELLWADGPSSFDGQYVSFEGLELHPKPIQRPRPPVLVGGRSDPALQRAVRYGDAWLPSQATLVDVVSGRERLQQIAADEGRPTPWIGINMWMALEDDEARAKDRLRSSLGSRFRTEDELFAATLGGPPAMIADRLDAYRAQGVTLVDLKFQPVGIDDAVERMQRFATDVMPQFTET